MPTNKRSDPTRTKKILAAATTGNPDTVYDLAICAAMGWTADQLHAQPTRFIERLGLYLDALARERQREQRRTEEKIRRMSTRP
ncbi:MAG: hypothetical protein NWF07_07660 [Candidatus Bathyarchaeota archaeon]|nr:hypothetical protein [Candidatus Bathyarchaeota archaeon]